MKNQFFRNINYHDAVIALLFFYFSFNYLRSAFSNIALIVVAAIFLLGVITKNIKIKRTKQMIFFYLLCSIPLVLTLISILLSNNMEPGWFYIKLRLPVLVLPFIFVNSYKNKEQLLKYVPIFFIISLYALIITIYNLIKIDPVSFYLLNTDCTPLATIIQHPYFGVLQLIAFVFTLELLRKKKNNRRVYYLLLILFTLGVVVSTSRICYVLYILILAVYLSKFISRKKAIIIFMIMAGMLAVVIGTSEAIQYKFTRSFNIETSPRLRLWNNAYMVWKHSETPILGEGIGDYYEVKGDPYWLRGYVNDLNEINEYKGLKGYNPHNQYIEFLLLNGVLGLAFVFMMGYMIYLTFKENGFISISLILILSLFTFTESVLNRQYGIVLFSLIIPIVYGLSELRRSNEQIPK